VIDQQTRQRILDSAQILDVVSDFISLRRQGVSYVGLCPFHSDRNPSFYVNPAKNICKCFSCGEGGTPLNFIMKHEQLSYSDALKYLAKKYNIEVVEREESEEEKQRNSERESLFIINDYAAKYFQTQLTETEEGRTVGLAYFRERGIRPETIERFGLGYAPESKTAFTEQAFKSGYPLKRLAEVGLSIEYEDHPGKAIDRFRGRVIFPVRNLSGRYVAFGGRVMSKTSKTAKYVNSPESLIYSKSRELYGLYWAKSAISKLGKCYLVEGYTDVLSMYQAGIENVVSSSGTALTIDQIRLIRRFTTTITVLYDGDAAGLHASLRGIDILLSEGLNIKIVLLPEGEDPDSYAHARTPEEFKKDLEEREEDFIEFKTKLLLKDAGRDPMKRANVITDITHSIAVIPSDIVRQVYIHDLAGRLSIDESAIVNEVAKEIRKIKNGTLSRSHPNTPFSSQSSAIVETPEQGQQPSASIGVPSIDSEIESHSEDIRETTHEAISPSTLAATAPDSLVSAKSTELSLGDSEAHKHLIACERQLVQLVIRYGQLPIIAPHTAVETPWSTSREVESSIVDDSPLVAPYILEDLSSDNILLQVKKHQQILEEAAQQTLSNLESFNSRTYFITHHDPEINRLAAELADDRYPLSMEQQKVFVPEEKRLVEIVPRVINDYKHAIIGVQKEEVLRALRQPELLHQPDKMNELLKKLIDINEIEKQFAKVLGDRVLVR